MPGRPSKPMSQTKINVSVCIAAIIAGGALYFGNVGSTFGSLPNLFSTIFTSFKETELLPYKCKSPDGSQDFQLLKELMDRNGATVDAVGLGTFDGIRGLQVMLGICKISVNTCCRQCSLVDDRESYDASTFFWFHCRVGLLNFLWSRKHSDINSSSLYIQHTP
ncbi:hypothetical protein DUNSADRAFT_15240 [Dunaliella salina]|uniref:Uncharacterized protein n=1 Tax=Dunaliella salina TaxID=3046 RepID=A0ABQ7H1Y2_DUNSA|nr:hypothetical protein DUNSADRAFT_15240 [Dunaliella salina]|eukprot:KAF5840872.1 hypothetical protein DUNSADRAFT_15240 [Dunaliella salina]